MAKTVKRLGVLRDTCRGGQRQRGEVREGAVGGGRGPREGPRSSVGLGRVVLGGRVQGHSCAVDAKILQIPGRIVQMTSDRRGQNQRMSCIHHQGSRKLSVLV